MVRDVVTVITKLLFLCEFALVEWIEDRGILEYRISPANQDFGIVSFGNEHTVLIVEIDRFEFQTVIFLGLGKMPLQGDRPCKKKRRGNEGSF